jgi:type II secretory pathway pseudopilin PulG
MLNIKKYSKNSKLSGALLLEILVVIGLFAILVPLVAQIIIVSLNTNKVAIENMAAVGLIDEVISTSESIGFSAWQNIYGLNKGGSNHYYPAKVAGDWEAVSGDEVVNVNGRDYSRYFVVTNVCRDNTTRNIITTVGVPPCTAGNSDDPSTQMLTITVNWKDRSISKIAYLTRWHNKICSQASWTGLGTGAVTCPSTLYDSATSIDISSTPGSLKIQAN